MASSLEVRLYRYDHPDGTSKDWAVPATPAPDALTVFYGRTGSALRRSDTPASRCEAGRPDREAESRRREKLQKGYRDLGLHRLADDRRTLTPATARPAPDAEGAAAAAQQSATPCLYWRWRPGAAGNTAIEAACREARAALAAVGWTVPGRGPEAGGVSWWAVVSGQAQNGIVPLVEGGQAAVAFWLLLARRVENLTLADEAGHRVTVWPVALPVAEETLEALGLKPKDARRLLAAAGGGTSWFF